MGILSEPKYEPLTRCFEKVSGVLLACIRNSVKDVDVFDLAVDLDRRYRMSGSEEMRSSIFVCFMVMSRSKSSVLCHDEGAASALDWVVWLREIMTPLECNFTLFDRPWFLLHLDVHRIAFGPIKARRAVDGGIAV